MSNRSFSEDPMYGAYLGQQMRQGSDYGELIKKYQSDLIDSMEQRATLIQEVKELREVAKSWKDETEFLDKKAKDYIFTLVGVRGVVRELLSELRSADKDNPLLDKKVRDALMIKAGELIESELDSTHYRSLSDKNKEFTEKTFGVQDAGVSGPNKKDISSNKALRKEAGVPDHVPESARLNTLVRILHSALKQISPEAAALNSAEMTQHIAIHKQDTIEQLESTQQGLSELEAKLTDTKTQLSGLKQKGITHFKTSSHDKLKKISAEHLNQFDFSFVGSAWVAESLNEIYEKKVTAEEVTQACENSFAFIKGNLLSKFKALTSELQVKSSTALKETVSEISISESASFQTHLDDELLFNTPAPVLDVKKYSSLLRFGSTFSKKQSKLAIEDLSTVLNTGFISLGEEAKAKAKTNLDSLHEQFEKTIEQHFNQSLELKESEVQDFEVEKKNLLGKLEAIESSNTY